MWSSFPIALIPNRPEAAFKRIWPRARMAALKLTGARVLIGPPERFGLPAGGPRVEFEVGPLHLNKRGSGPFYVINSAALQAAQLQHVYEWHAADLATYEVSRPAAPRTRTRAACSTRRRRPSRSSADR